MIYFDFCMKGLCPKKQGEIIISSILFLNLNPADSTFPMGGLCPPFYPQLRRTWLRFFDTLDAELFYGASDLLCDILLQYWAGQKAQLSLSPSITKGMVTILQGTVTKLWHRMSSLNAFVSHDIFYQQWLSCTVSNGRSRNMYLVHAFKEVITHKDPGDPIYSVLC